MKRLSNRIYNLYSTLSGNRFWAVYSDVGQTLTVKNPSIPKVGEIIKDAQGNKSLLLFYPQSGNDLVQFKVSPVTEELIWIRHTKTTDPVSRLPKEGAPTTMGTVYCSLTNPTEEETAQFIDIRYQFLTGQDIQVGDTVGKYTIKKVVDVQGVKLGYAQ